MGDSLKDAEEDRKKSILGEIPEQRDFSEMLRYWEGLEAAVFLCGIGAQNAATLLTE